MLKVGFLGLGQAGSNICEVAEQYGYRTAVANTSRADLESITGVRNKLLIGNNDGCGKDRSIAKEEAKKHYKELVNFVKEKFVEEDIVYLVHSTGGGTGSGMSPIFSDVLTTMIPEKTFGIISVLPSFSESMVAQVNTLECLNEIYKLGLPTILLDNNKFKPGISRKGIFDNINAAIISDFNALFKERKSSKYGNLDTGDLKKILKTPGVMLIKNANFKENEVEESTLSKVVMNSWDDNIYCPVEYDNVIKRAGFIYEIPESMTRSVDYASINKEIGVPLEVFEGYYTPQKGDLNIVSVLSGMSFPESRIDQLKEHIKKRKEDVSEKAAEITIEKSEIDWFGKLRDESQVKKVEKADIDDIMSKY